jgi:tryptophan-rich hypothetical protein
MQMSNPSARRLSPKKLLRSKWTAAIPKNKEKHFLVVKVVEPDSADAPVEFIELEAVYSGRTMILPWQDLTDTEQWLQGWQ